jgi:hypothetical protein
MRVAIATQPDSVVRTDPVRGGQLA